MMGRGGGLEGRRGTREGRGIEGSKFMLGGWLWQDGKGLTRGSSKSGYICAIFGRRRPVSTAE